MIGESNISIFSKIPINNVVKIDPTSVFIAISFPRNIKAIIIKAKLSITRMVPGEKVRKEFKITDIPLVPPSKREWGKINDTVLKAYKTLPAKISR